MPKGLFRYLRDLRKFRKSGNSLELRLYPCLHDWWEQAGAITNEYFWQDLFIARMVHAASPQRHVDVGSRLDGFVAHLAAFREVEVFDIRPLQLAIPGVTFRQADMMRAESLPAEHTDSLSCLHAIEHFGLGRYGDPIESNGVALGLQGLAKLLQPDGLLYLSCPLGSDVVHFNAHRSLHPQTVVDMAAEQGLKLERCWLFDHTSKTFNAAPERLTDLTLPATQTLGIYVLRKLSPI